VAVDGNGLSLEAVEAVAREYSHAQLSPAAIDQLNASRERLAAVVDKREIVYGITTGFGKFKDVIIEPEDSSLLQRNLIHSHAASVGPSFDIPTTRAATLLRANALAKGYSGVRKEVVQLLLGMLNAKVHPVI